MNEFNSTPFQNILRDYLSFRYDFGKNFEVLVKSNMEPAPEEAMLTDKEGYMRINWHVLYSPYLTKMTRLPSQAEFRDKYDPLVRENNKRIDEY